MCSQLTVHFNRILFHIEWNMIAVKVFPFNFQSSLNSIWFKIEMKTVTAMIFLSLNLKGNRYPFSRLYGFSLGIHRYSAYCGHHFTCPIKKRQQMDLRTNLNASAYFGHIHFREPFVLLFHFIFTFSNRVGNGY